MSKLTGAEAKRAKAMELRYKRAVADGFNFNQIIDEVTTISEECSDIRYLDEETVLNALDDNEEEFFEFKITFSDLSVECERLLYQLRSMYVEDYFDTFFVGIMCGGNEPYNIVGFDSYEEDYFTLCSFDNDLAKTEAFKRLMRIRKDELISAMGQCFGVAVSYMNVMMKYERLKAAFDILQDTNTGLLEIIREIDKLYTRADADEWEGKTAIEFDRLTKALPDKLWIE